MLTWQEVVAKWMPENRRRVYSRMSVKQLQRLSLVQMWEARVEALLKQDAPRWMIAMMQMNYVLALHGYVTPGFGASVSLVANQIFDEHVLPEMK